MSYFPRGHHRDDEDVDDFDEYDPTPYGGGYDISLTYGRPIPPSEETCYPVTSSGSGDFDYDRPQYTSYAEPSAYASEALEEEYKNYARPAARTRPSYGAPSGGEEEGGYERPKPNYGFQPGMNRPSGGYGGESEYGGGAGYGGGQERPTSDYGSGYGRKPNPEYGSEETGYGGGQERPSSEYGPGYGGRPNPEYGSGYERAVSEYGSRPEQPGYGAPGSGYGRKSESNYGQAESEYPPPSSDYGSEYGRKPSYGESGYGGRSEKPEYERPSYGSQSYETPVAEGYGGSSFERPSYGRAEEEDYRKPTYGRRDEDEEGYGRQNYGENYGEDEGRKHHGKHHHGRKHYDD